MRILLKFYLDIFLCIPGKPYSGSKVVLKKESNALICVPCRFDLTLYPFGGQICSLQFTIQGIHRIKMDYYSQSLTKEEIKINYQGSSNLGEFSYVRATTYRHHTDYHGIIDIHLKCLYGYHLLNSFTPSTLMVLISFASLFFPIVNFNERVMVSLTSLLVLAALFTQASETSVKTSYFKLLDVWYVTMIFFCFVVVVFNICLHKISIEDITHRKKGIYDLTKNEEFEEQNQVKSTKKATRLNLVMKILLFFFYALFLIVYILIASEIIPYVRDD